MCEHLTHNGWHRSWMSYIRDIGPWLTVTLVATTQQVATRPGGQWLVAFTLRLDRLRPAMFIHRKFLRESPEFGLMGMAPENPAPGWTGYPRAVTGHVVGFYQP